MARSIFICFIFVVLSLTVTSCGKKGEPTMRSFDKPASVKELKAVHKQGEIIISWSYPSSEIRKLKGFYLDRSDGNGDSGFRNIAFLQSDASRFIDREFTRQKHYLYKIRALSIMDVMSDDSPLLKVSPAESPPPPENLEYELKVDSVIIKWDHLLKDSVRFNVYKGYEKDRLDASPLNKTPLKDMWFKDSIEMKRPVYYVVTALLNTEILDEGYQSETLMVDPKDFVPSKPSGIRFVITERGVHLLWDENPETWVTKYRVYKKKASENVFKLIGDSIIPAFTDNEPLVTPTFYYLTAVGPERESPHSESIEILPVMER